MKDKFVNAIITILGAASGYLLMHLIRSMWR